ncbi:MAG: hypothetical protein R2788_06225 [Saprospiraceae bacterium]
MKEKTVIKVLTKAYKKAAKRTRKAFLVTNILSILLFFSLFNYRMSWFLTQKDHIEAKKGSSERRNLLFKEELIEFLEGIKESNSKDSSVNGISKIKIDTIIKKIKIDTIAKSKESNNHLKIISENLEYDPSRSVMEDTYLQHFLFFSIPIIGIKIYIQDVPLLGGVSLFIFLTWYLFARKKEFDITCQLCRETVKLSDGKMIKYSKYKIFSSSIFKPENKPENLKLPLFNYFERKLKYLIYLPFLILLSIQSLDIIETYVPNCGPKEQNLVKIDGKYFRFNYFFKTKIIQYGIPEDYMMLNVRLVDYLNFYNSDPFLELGIKKWKIYAKFLAMHILSLLILSFCLVQTKNIIKIINNENKVQQVLKNVFRELPAIQVLQRDLKGLKNNENNFTFNC